MDNHGVGFVPFPWRALLDFALPPRCPACGTIVHADHRFCLPCWQSLEFLTGEGCAHCGMPSTGPSGTLCGRCLKAIPSHDRVLAVVAYGDISRRLVLRLKYSRRPGLARTIGALLAARHQLDPGAVLVPVPLHRWRLWQRGFNQSLAIARALQSLTGVGCEHCLIERHRRTPPMRGLNPSQRHRALSGAFRSRKKLDGRHVYLVDDVYTTGATASACARTLKQAGASRVTVLCWARVVHSD